jgi:hypothetical protein
MSTLRLSPHFGIYCRILYKDTLRVTIFMQAIVAIDTTGSEVSARGDASMSRSASELMGTPEELFYWIPGEMVAVVQLPQIPADETLDTLSEQVRRQLNVILSPYSLVLELYGSAGRWQETPSMPPVRRRAFLFGLKRRHPYAAIFFHVRHADSSVPDPMPMALSYLQGRLEQLAQSGLILVSAMPNWLMTAAPIQYSSGGPAMPPRPAPPLELASTESNTPVGWHFSFIDPAIPRGARGNEDVVVAVLDTAHHPDQLVRAAKRSELRQNWLLQRLVGELSDNNGSFEIEYDGRYYVTDDVRTGRDATSNARYYPMTDHGLFIAGMIRDLAPHARIRLIRILNDFGGGDLYTLFAALTDLERELSNGTISRLVLNLSLTMMPEIRRLPYLWFYDRTWQSKQLMAPLRVLTHIEEGLRLLFQCLHEQGALIVAPAGNDSFQADQKGEQRHPPRAPARYESTLSVTSVNSRFAPSLFANAASSPPVHNGVATFGGDSYALMDANGMPDAVRGLYISTTFPEGERNTTGWADWSGTSFAAAIISGLGAHCLAQGLSLSDTMERILSGYSTVSGAESLFGTGLDVPNLLANLVRVRQRFGQP